MPFGRYPIRFKIPNWPGDYSRASCGDLTGTRQGFPAPPGPRMRHLTEIMAPGVTYPWSRCEAEPLSARSAAWNIPSA